MAVTTTNAYVSYSGNDATTAFSVTFQFLSSSELVVTLISSAGAETVKTLTTHYTVTGGTDSNGLPATGTLTMLTAPATGETLRIERNTTKTQATAYTNNDAFPAKTHEAALDKARIIDQENVLGLARAAKIHFTDYIAGFDPSIPTGGEAGDVLVINADEDGFSWEAATASTASVSSFMETVLDDTTAAAARTTLGVGNASTTAAGIIEIATDAEVQAGADTDRAITAANLQACTGTESRKGVLELATDAETKTGTDTARAITPANLTAKEATTAEFLANTSNLILTTDQANAAGAIFGLTDGASIAWDMASGFNASVTLGGNRTLSNPTNTIVGRSGAIVVTQDGTGSRTLAYGTSWEFAGGVAVVLTTTAGAKDTLFYWIQSSTSIIITGIKKALS